MSWRGIKDENYYSYVLQFECCGRASPQDYIVNDRLPPATCFANGDSKVVENLIAIGCRAKVEHFVTDLLHIFNCLAWVLIVLEVSRCKDLI